MQQVRYVDSPEAPRAAGGARGAEEEGARAQEHPAAVVPDDGGGGYRPCPLAVEDRADSADAHQDVHVQEVDPEHKLQSVAAVYRQAQEFRQRHHLVKAKVPTQQQYQKSQLLEGMMVISVLWLARHQHHLHQVS